MRQTTRTPTDGEPPLTTSNLRVKIFADGADMAGILELCRNPLIKGFTTNPTLMRKAGVTDYSAFARELLEAVPDRPISFEVFSDEFDEMERQARASPAGARTSTSRSPSPTPPASRRRPWSSGLAAAGIKVNVTALITLGQVARGRRPPGRGRRRVRVASSPAASPTPAAIRCR